MEEMTLEEAKKVIEIYGIDADRYISENIKHFMDDENNPSDNSYNLNEYFKTCLRVVVSNGLK